MRILCTLFFPYFKHCFLFPGSQLQLRISVEAVPGASAARAEYMERLMSPLDPEIPTDGPFPWPPGPPGPPGPCAKESTQRCAPAVSQRTRSVAVYGEVKPCEANPFSRISAICIKRVGQPDWNRYNSNKIEHDSKIFKDRRVYNLMKFSKFQLSSHLAGFEGPTAAAPSGSASRSLQLWIFSDVVMFLDCCPIVTIFQYLVVLWWRIKMENEKCLPRYDVVPYIVDTQQIDSRL